MAQISSRNGFKQSAPAAVGYSGKRAVGKEEALQMEAEALAKLQKERSQSLKEDHPVRSASSARQKSPNTVQEYDLIHFPEAEISKKRAADALSDLDIEKLTSAELEKLLLDKNFGPKNITRPPTLPNTPLVSPSFSSPFYSQALFSGGQWTGGIQVPVVQTSAYHPTPVTYPKQPDPFQNGFGPSPGQSSYRPSESIYIGLQGHQYMPFPLQSATPVHPTRVLPPYSTVPPELAKLYDKIASTSEYLKNSKTSNDLESSSTMVPKLPVCENSNDVSKFDWLDLDPLNKARIENLELSYSSTDIEPKVDTGTVAADPWEQVLQKQSPLESSPPDIKSEVASFNQSSVKSASGISVTRSLSLNLRSTSSQLSDSVQGQSDKSSQVDNGTNNDLKSENILEQTYSQNEEVAAFWRELIKLRSTFPYSDHSTNPGYILSPVMLHRDMNGENASVKVSIEIEEFQEPVTFTCDVSSHVELIIMQALCWAHDDLNKVDIGSYILKVCGQEEVLQNKHCLGSHEYIQNCRKCDAEIKLQLLNRSTMSRAMSRMAEDDETPTGLEKYLCRVEKPFKDIITRQSLAELLEVYHTRTKACLQREGKQYKMVEQITQSVKDICNALDGAETKAVTDAVKKLKRAVNLPKNKTIEVKSKDNIGSTNGAKHGSSLPENPVNTSIHALTLAVYDLLQLYLSSFSRNTDATGSLPQSTKCTKEAQTTTEHLQFTLFAAHRIPGAWVSSFEKYFLMCSLTHNGKDIFKPVQSKKVGTYRSFFYHIKWDELISFPVQIAQLPLESILSLGLYGVPNPSAAGSPDSNKQRKGSEYLGRVSMPLFDFKRVLTSGTKLLGLCTSILVNPSGTTNKKGNSMERIVVQVDFPSFTFDIVYCPPQPSRMVELDFETLDQSFQKQLLEVFAKDLTYELSKTEKELLWDMRQYCFSHSNSLPKLLASAPSWDWDTVPEIYTLLRQWKPLSPVAALELLDSKFADQEVRSTAVKWIEVMSDDELIDYLPQFVEAMKHECYLDNALVKFLLSRALGNIAVAHHLYWLLKDSLHDPYFGMRYELFLGGLLYVCGKGLRQEFEKQTRLVRKLGVVAEKVRQASGSSRQIVLQEGMDRVQSFFKNKCRLPLNPSLVAKELNVKACSFFSSNAVPLKVTLVNADPLGDEINVMFKIGEDLRQDMLALQMIKIMDKIWLQEGLDLRMVIFKCISTGKDRGMVELVPASETLRKIQVEYGVTGSFKDKPLAEWLRKYNATEEEYEKASENFIYSCAGCCVATYVLGICDRHNDNIMLRSTGHMFHIDFGKFLGHAQMFGSFRRDRAPFVLTSDMAYVINGGEKPTSRFQLFVDLCCQSYNLIRKHANHFLNLLSLMLSSGLPELTTMQDLKYVQDALQPQTTDAEATIFFTRLIESSLGSMATKFNFLIHNLAQLRFSGLPSNEQAILSFSPKTYSLKQDGRIKEVTIYTYQKRYNPDKYYIYVVRVLREGQIAPTFIFRTFDEFQELHNKLGILFPLWKLPGFPNKVVLGRTHIKDVASKRKVELNNYVQCLMNGSTEVAECDLIYTFFHPLSRDEKAEGIEGIVKPSEIALPSPSTGQVGGEVKLSISYRNNTLFIMVMHIRDLVTEDGADPNPYVKTYLLPDPHKITKHKTKVSRKTENPTYNEMLVYSGYSKESLEQRKLQLSVLSAESLRENVYLGGVTLTLKEFDLSKETVNWYKLTAVPSV
ncbi:phosphatidylinositol 4-phosphate 3-kinase C2 domain-containing subunit alpha isoform X1 [Hemiscyllium ocellatum]|uniref:phosphatidylinositol 4-phosphate 3-kinase C2 domain-containing subunit alpha isoform X1 n=1 Tax=Hemiscyllium ocellatum TaxID=170820 RepID=UPI00296687F5|nr:phosphatidylinositol 4-phosphate 3-kinase C2 domain-containing subunit alpha isoform X1 [Hemiscyllium ocellatum]XP_060694931.1 phosphatidylinositol 4-phosphate 3-kinase C2 domain-containing subunit alpha isoform X1 [Hemiscyllium ocellatum]XP_060694932.1 phosphatidylinositol 4-phosphate 3-kinase C2 domain-containing subunit alpha isoform X1 [Hemiscyllium ocellatum]XP_060694933.1 phosphatidylinositol 4-phosphate 3-kinase C2 domain-containing subunit alpha isoform X1 [Hemiscyllium ocellatum]XP_